jgi:protein-S-isoprenylcysteine O-methyltransferase Ste14
MPTAGAGRTAGSLVVALGGAVAFLASLLWGTYAYLYGFDARPSWRTAAAPVTVDVGLFTLFALHHSLFARTGAKRLVERHAPPALERSIYTWAASLLFIIVCALWQPVPGTLYRLEGAARAVAYSVQLAGMTLTIHSASVLGFFELAGVGQVRRARRHMADAHVPLETRGVYGFVRHPLYFAWVLMVFATPDMTATRLTFAIVSTAYLAIAIPWEERSLVKVFGGDYEAYRERVRWRMLPGLY